MTNDERNNVLIELNRTGFYKRDGVWFYGYSYAAGRMPKQVKELHHQELSHIIKSWFDDYFENVIIEPLEYDMRFFYFKGIMPIGEIKYAFPQRISYDEVNETFQRGEMEKLKAWLTNYFNDVLISPTYP